MLALLNTARRSTSKRTAILLALMALALSACGGGSHNTHEDVVYIEISENFDEPELYQFHVIDTYETNTEFDENTFLALSPYVNNGEFEVYWDTHSDDEYVVELLFSESPSPVGARTISTEWCGPYEYCDNNQYQFCEYTSNLYLSCESSNGDYQSNYIGDLLHTFPQDSYLILQVCDSNYFYCEYETRTVSME